MMSNIANSSCTRFLSIAFHSGDTDHSGFTSFEAREYMDRLESNNELNGFSSSNNSPF
jgi:hypothetical protein